MVDKAAHKADGDAPRSGKARNRHYPQRRRELSPEGHSSHIYLEGRRKPKAAKRSEIFLKSNGFIERLALDAWFDEVRKARWSSAADVKRSYATASIVSADRIVFNIKGNDYRLVVATDFDKGIVWIKWIGTHKDYDKIDVKEVQHGG
jgi:mRNA interferase HigB